MALILQGPSWLVLQPTSPKDWAVLEGHPGSPPPPPVHAAAGSQMPCPDNGFGGPCCCIRGGGLGTCWSTSWCCLPRQGQRTQELWGPNLRLWCHKSRGKPSLAEQLEECKRAYAEAVALSLGLLSPRQQLGQGPPRGSFPGHAPQNSQSPPQCLPGQLAWLSWILCWTGPAPVWEGASPGAALHLGGAVQPLSQEKAIGSKWLGPRSRGISGPRAGQLPSTARSKEGGLPRRGAGFRAGSPGQGASLKTLPSSPAPQLDDAKEDVKHWPSWEAFTKGLFCGSWEEEEGEEGNQARILALLQLRQKLAPLVLLQMAGLDSDWAEQAGPVTEVLLIRRASLPAHTEGLLCFGTAPFPGQATAGSIQPDSFTTLAFGLAPLWKILQEISVQVLAKNCQQLVNSPKLWHLSSPPAGKSPP